MTPTTLEERCHREAAKTDFPDLVAELRKILGAELVAYIASKRETRVVRTWMEGKHSPSAQVQRRLRLAYQAAKCIAEVDGPLVAQSWFQGLNPRLDDVSPARLLREGDPEIDGKAVLAAERDFLRNG